MIKFLGEKEGRPCIGLGLSRGNCQKLIEGKPIFIDLKVMLAKVEKVPDLNEATILIFGGETEEEMAAKLGKLPEATHRHHEEN